MPQAWHLKSRPNGLPTADNFEFKDVALPELGDGMVHVRNHWLSVDPYMRGRMNDVKSYVPPFQIGEPLEGGAVGEVVESRSPDFQPGDKVLHMMGWRDEAVVPAQALNKLPSIPGVEPQAFLGNLGLTGGTAYWGLLDAAKAKAGDIVFVSAAAGAVGSAVVQIAKAKGMTVIGSAGGADKVAFVKSLGADECIDYKAGVPLVKALSEVAPKGIDVYFDNVGGEHLDAALALARRDARFAICGMIDGYNSGAPTQPALHHARDRDADHAQGLHLHRLSAPQRRILRRDGSVGRERRGQGPRHGGRGARQDPRRLPRPVHRRQHRQDAGQAVRSKGPHRSHRFAAVG